MKGGRYEENGFTVDGGVGVLVGVLRRVGLHDRRRAIRIGLYQF